MMAFFDKLLTLKCSYSEEEQHLLFKTKALIFLGFLTGSIVFSFSIYRFINHEYLLSSADLIFSSVLFGITYFLRLKKKLYNHFASIFIILSGILIAINFNVSQDNHTRILWFSTLLVFTFYLKNRVFGFWVLGFFMLLLFFSSEVGGSHFSTIENITVFINLSLISIIMFWYDKFREADTNKLIDYNAKLEKQVQARTAKLHKINTELQEKVNTEVAIRLKHEHLLFEKTRLADMGKMLDNIAHQWRQPLMNINASLLNMQREDELHTLTSTSLTEYIDTIESTTTYMSHTIDDFRNFFKNDDFKEKTTLPIILSNVLTLLKSATKEIQIDSHISITDDATFFKGEMTQVLISLLLNATEAMKSHHVQKKHISISASLENGFYQISVEDNGGGIAPDKLSKIFNPYFSTKKNIGGSGLGLYTSKIIVENHFNGKLLVRNGKQGAKFTLYVNKENH